MPQVSAGLLMFRHVDGALEVLLAHPGGPYFRKKDLGAWTLPKGLVEPGEEPLACALREFREETGIVPAAAHYLPLGEVRLKSGKRVHAWAFEGAWDGHGPPPSNTFEVEWPPKSGRMATFPEIDRVAFFDLETARAKILAAQAPLLDRLQAALAG